MDARIRREALKAAAKVAVSLVAVSGIACGAKIDGASKDDALTAGNDDYGTDTPRPPTSGDGEEGNVSSPPKPPSSKADAAHTDVATSGIDAAVDTAIAMDANVDLAACDAKLTALKVDSGGEWPPAPFVKTPENVACCTAILDEIEKDWQFQTENQWACCATTAPNPDQPFHRMACTPWGPPMPPEMPAFLLAAVA